MNRGTNPPVFGFIDQVTYETFGEKLWHFPVRDSWGIAGRMERNLARMGIYTICDLAKANLPRMKARFGRKIGEQMVFHSQGIDLTYPYHKPEMSHQAIIQKGFGSALLCCGIIISAKKFSPRF